MKLCRFGPKGAEKPGMLDAEGRVRDLSGVTEDFQGDALSLGALDKLRAVDTASLPLAPEGARLGAALADVPNWDADPRRACAFFKGDLGPFGPV